MVNYYHKPAKVQPPYNEWNPPPQPYPPPGPPQQPFPPHRPREHHYNNSHPPNNFAIPPQPHPPPNSFQNSFQPPPQNFQPPPQNFKPPPPNNFNHPPPNFNVAPAESINRSFPLTPGFPPPRGPGEALFYQIAGEDPTARKEYFFVEGRGWDMEKLSTRLDNLKAPI